jgi:hypothetical protein
MRTVVVLLAFAAPAFAKGPKPGLYQTTAHGELSNGTKVGPTSETKCNAGTLVFMMAPENVKADPTCHFLVGPKSEDGRTSYEADCPAGRAKVHLVVQFTDTTFDFTSTATLPDVGDIKTIIHGERKGDCSR